MARPPHRARANSTRALPRTASRCRPRTVGSAIAATAATAATVGYPSAAPWAAKALSPSAPAGWAKPNGTLCPCYRRRVERPCQRQPLARQPRLRLGAVGVTRAYRLVHGRAVAGRPVAGAPFSVGTRACRPLQRGGAVGATRACRLVHGGAVGSKAQQLQSTLRRALG